MWTFALQVETALNDHTEAVHKGIRNEYDTCSFCKILFCKV